MSIPHFVFSLDHAFSAIDATYVEEVFALPEMTLIPDAPLGVVGVINLRGEILPVVVLNSGDRDRPESYALTDKVIVVRQEHLRIGVFTTAVHGMQDIASHTVEAIDPAQIGWTSSRAKEWVAGLYAGDEDNEDIVVLNQPKHWFDALGIQQIVSVTSFLVDELQNDHRKSHFPATTSEEQEIFRQRAYSLRQSFTEDQTSEQSQNLVVARVGDQLVGIESQIVKEFITVQQAVPIPCCPPHIIGSLNLRGTILTIVDICSPLELPIKELTDKPKAIVVELETVSAAIVVEKINDAMFSVNSNQLKAPLSHDKMARAGYVRSVTSYQGEKLYVLDLPTLLSSDDVVVNERA